MEPGWLPEANDVAKTLISGAQAAAAWRRSSATRREEDGHPDEVYVVHGASTAVPCEPGPDVAHGRDDVVRRLVNLVGKKGRGQPQLLVGAGGMGKSTIARLVADRVRNSCQKARIWWISAVNEESLSGGLISLARDLGASAADQETIRTNTVASLGDVADRIWSRLAAQPEWLLVVDNADDPSMLGPSDGTGWIRQTGRGLLLVTTRSGNESCWPGWVDPTTVGPLSVAAAAKVLTVLAPQAGDPAAARDLAQRLGCLPLALRMAGMYLRRDFAVWHTFNEYQRALDADGVGRVIEVSNQADQRAVITQTWELSLDALVKSGLPQARPLLWLLSCYAPGSRIPLEIVTASGRRDRLAALLDPQRIRSTNQLTQNCLDGLDGLASVGLIHRLDTDGGSAHIELHPFIAEVTRTMLDAGNQARLDPSLVRDSAVAAIRTMTRRLDVSRADHWRTFHVLAPHVQALLSGTARHLGDRQRRNLLDCMVRCVTSYLWSRAEPRAEQLAEHALEVARTLDCECTSAYLRLRHVHAWSIRDQDRFAEAAESFREVLAAQQQLRHGATGADALHTRHDLAWAMGRLGRWTEAEQELRHVLREWRARLQRRGRQRDDQFILHTRCKLCWCVGKQGQWELAERDYRVLLADRAEILGANHADTLDTLESLGKALAWQGKWADAETEFRTLAARRALTLGEQHPDTLLARQLETYAVGYQALRRHDRRTQRAELTRLEKILRDQEAVRGTEHRDTRDSRAFLAALRGTYPPDLSWTEDLPRPETG